MAKYPLSLNSGKFDALKKVLGNCAFYTGDIAIKSSHIVKQFDAEVCSWLTGNLESVLGIDVSMNILLDKIEIKELLLIEGDNGVSIDFIKDEYVVSDGITNAHFTCFPPTDFEDDTPPSIDGLPLMGTITELDEEETGRLVRVCKKRGPIELYFDANDELYAVRNSQKTLLNITASAVAKNNILDNGPTMVLLSNFLEMVQANELTIEIFKQQGIDDYIHGDIAYWARYTIKLGIMVKLIVLERLMESPAILREDFTSF